MSVTLSASALWTAISDVLPLAGRAAGEHPQIKAVRLEADGQGNLLAIATDRFACGISRVDCQHGGTLAVTLTGPHARAVMHQARRAIDCDAAAIADVDEDGTVTTRSSAGLSTLTGQTLPEWIDWSRLIPANPEVGGELRVDAERLARFAKVRSALRYDDRPMTLTPTRKNGTPSIIIVRIGADFVGGVMPIRSRGEAADYTRPGWLP